MKTQFRSDAELPMPDAFMAEAHRKAAEAALKDWNYTPKEQRERHSYYMRKAEEAERGTRSPAR